MTTDWKSVYKRAARIIDAAPGIDGETAFKLALQQEEEARGVLTLDGLKVEVNSCLKTMT